MLTVKRLSGKERFDAQLISTFCFHRRIENIEAERESIENKTDDDWGAFTEDGTLIAHIVNNSFHFNIDGQYAKTGGIGAVSTLPEYRNFGAIKSIFSELLQNAYKNGEVISALYPFNHNFYGKFGYEIVLRSNTYTFSPSVLSLYRTENTITRYTAGDDITPYKKIYDEFIKNYNLSAIRTHEQIKEKIGYKNLFTERKFSYRINDGKNDIAYLTFTDVYHNPGAILSVNECAWINKDGFNSILAFLARFTADYERIELSLPMGIDLLKIVKSKDTYDIQKKVNMDFMARVINAQKLLEVIKKNENCDIKIKITDDLIEENNGVFHITKNQVIKTDEKSTDFDMCVSERAFVQLAIGAISFEESLLRDDVELVNNEKFDILNQVFTPKKIFVTEHF